MICMILKCILMLITNHFKLPQNFEFPEAELFFRFVWFEKFPWVCYSCLMGRRNLLMSSVLFCHKNGSSRLKYCSKKTYRKWSTSVKHSKTSKCSNNNKKSNIITQIFLDEYAVSYRLTPLFLKGGNSVGKPKGEGSGNAKVLRRMGFFHFHFLTIRYHDN